MGSLEPAPSLAVNDGPLTADDIGELTTSTTDLPLAELRDRYRREGYLLVKNLLPREDVLQARASYFSMMGPTGVLERDTPVVEGRFNHSERTPDEFPGIGAGSSGKNARPGDERAAQLFVDLALSAHFAPWYADVFCKHPALLEFVAELTGWGDATLPLKRSLLRNNVPGTKPIGVHYDQIFLRYGEESNITAWVPMGDVALEGGGLIYLEDSTSIGRDLEASFSAQALATGLSATEAKSAFNANMMSTGLISEKPLEFSRQHGRRWLVGAYDAGDVVFHSPYTIHASTVNHDRKGVIRLATDLRFCDSRRPFDERWMNVYTVGDGV